VPTAGGDVHLLEARGDGPLPTLVALHGLSSAGFHYYPFLHRLRPAVRQVVALDLPGHGLSAVPQAGLTPATMREGLYGAFEALVPANEKVILFGNSLGGLAALRYALVYPERVHALALFSPGGAMMTDDELEELRRGFRLRTHRAALAFVDRVFARPSPLRHVFAWGVRQTFAPAHIQNLVSQLHVSHLLREEELAALAVPTLLLWGEHDRVLPATNLAFFRRALPAHATVELQRGVGHTPFLEQVDSVAERVLRFLDAVPASAP
jgi:pimeloyl-ACP methyl ester carboxylesterase